MLKIKQEITESQLAKYGFAKNDKSVMEKVIGVLSIYVDLMTREINGIGFYPVGDRIVLRNLGEKFIEECLEVSE